MNSNGGGGVDMMQWLDLEEGGMLPVTSAHLQ